MNWVPGNLHLIGKDNQNNPPSFQIKSRLPHAPPPTYTFTAGMQGHWWGEADKCCARHETQLLQKDSRRKTILFLCSSPAPAIYLRNLKCQDNMVRWHVFQLFCPRTPTTSMDLKESGLFLKRWSLASQRGHMPSLHPQLASDSSYVK